MALRVKLVSLMIEEEIVNVPFPILMPFGYAGDMGEYLKSEGGFYSMAPFVRATPPKSSTTTKRVGCKPLPKLIRF